MHAVSANKILKGGSYTLKRIASDHSNHTQLLNGVSKTFN